MSRRVRIAGMAGLLGVALVLPAAAAPGDLTLVSRTSGGAAADGDSFYPAISTDGARVAFVSDADNLSADEARFDNVFVHDLRSGATTLVSRTTAGAGASGASGDPVISGDGRKVAFSSEADNLSVEDLDTVSNVYLRDVAVGTTVLVSRVDGPGNSAGNGASTGPSISGDGRLVAFTSVATNLSADDTDTHGEVFVRDVVAGLTTLVSRADGIQGAAGDAVSREAAISGDGRWVAFSSEADNFSTADVDTVSNVFLRDLANGTTTLVSRATGTAGAGGTGASFGPAVSADGRFVAFESQADNLSAADDDRFANVFVRDMATGTTTLVSRAGGAGGAGADADSALSSIADDGRSVGFESKADNLSPGDVNAVDNVFVRDLAAGTTTLVSRGPGNGAGAGAGSATASLSGDGRLVAFSSLAGNVSSDDRDGTEDVFVRELGPVAGGGGAEGGGGAVVSVRCAGLKATIVGTPGRDVLRGTPRRDVIAALAGNDRVLGLAGNDVICLGAGNDRASGGAGRDRILGGAGRDVLVGGAGRDLLVGGPGRDRVRS